MVRPDSGLAALVLALAACRAEAVPPKVEAVEVGGTPAPAATLQDVGESPSASASSRVDSPDAGASRLRGNVQVGPATMTVPVSRAM